MRIRRALIVSLVGCLSATACAAGAGSTWQGAASPWASTGTTPTVVSTATSLVHSSEDGRPAPSVSADRPPTDTTPTAGDAGAAPNGTAAPDGTAAPNGTAAPTTTTPEPPGPRTVTVLGSGDVLLHEYLWDQAAADAKAAGASGYDFGPLYAHVAPAVESADVAICQMETPVASDAGPFSAWPRFSVPPQVLTAIKAAGYDSCTTASNHTLDAGPAGVVRTLDAMDAAGIEHTGSARSPEEAAAPLILTTENGVRIGQLAYTFSFNGLQRPSGKDWLANLIDVAAILAAAAKLKAAGADIVVLSMHWGVEYQHLPSATQRKQAETLLAAPDIDLILGDHAHVIQPMQRIGDKWVVYSMGNQVARHADPIDATREGIMPRVTFTEQPDGTFRTSAVEIVPTWVQFAPDLRLLDLSRALADPATSAADRDSYRTITDRISGYVNALGADVPVAAPPIAPN